MIQGTGSSVGKSLLVTGLCRIFAQDGYRVAPFKAQNMSLNSAVTPDGLEIGRAQAVQAAAAGIEPDVAMNPILLKPEGNAVSQLVAMGKLAGTVRAREFLTRRERLWTIITQALDALRDRFDLVVIEGAGSPAEINLRAGDIVNMEVALYARAPVFIVGDIDTGGVFAALYGTHALLAEQERRLVRGFIINKFRGDPTLLTSGFDQLTDLTGVPVVGLVPWLEDVYVPEEDAPQRARTSPGSVGDASVDVVVIALPHIANFDEFDPLARRVGVRLRYIRRVEEFGDPDLVILPGSKTTVSDLAFLQRSGLAAQVSRHASAGRALLGICGGMQMLGRSIADPHGIESSGPTTPGLELLDIDTTFRRDKQTTRTQARVTRNAGLLAGARGLDLDGYEIHVGVSRSLGGVTVALESANGREPLGFTDASGWIVGTYVHDLFKNDALTDRILHNLAPAARSGPQAPAAPFSQDAEFDKLADHLRACLDLRRIRQEIQR